MQQLSTKANQSTLRKNNLSEEVIDNIKKAGQFFIKKPFYHPYNIGITLAIIYSKSFKTYVNVGVSGSHFLIPLTKLYQNVIGFEPDDIIQEINDDIVNYKNISCYNIALSNTETTKTFYKVDGLATFEFNQDWAIRHLPVTTVDITTTTLDLFLINNPVDKLDYLKIDAEYEDPNIVLGSIDTIEKHIPIIQIETINKDIHNVLCKLDYIKYHLSLYMFPREIRNKNVDHYYIHKSMIAARG